MKVLDLFSGAGGAAYGLWQACQDAGVEVDIVGVDLRPQPRYPFTFVEADAMTYPLEGFDFIWASPPCQRYSVMSACRPGLQDQYLDGIADTRARLQAAGVPFVIENVPGAPLNASIMLCGASLGLPLYRHRLFETSWPVLAPGHRRHTIRGGRAGHWKPGQIISVSGNCSPIRLAEQAMGIDWMRRDELSESIPPAYSRYLLDAYLRQQPRETRV